MPQFLTAAIVLAICVGLVMLAFSAWRRRLTEQAIRFGAPAESFAEASTEEILASAPAQYVATTFRDEPLNRVTAYGLGFRGRAQVNVSAAGVTIARKGERNLALANIQISDATFEQATIDRVVEKNGLLAINWRQDSTDLTTFLRFNNAIDRNRILQASSVLARKAI